MSALLGLLLILLGLILWTAAGLLPVVRLERTPGPGVDAALRMTWMGLITLMERRASGVRGARLVRDPTNAKRVRVEIALREGWIALTASPLLGEAPKARVAQIVDRFAKEARVKEITLPLRSRMGMMLRFALLFPLGTVNIFTGVLMVVRGLG